MYLGWETGTSGCANPIGSEVQPFRGKETPPPSVMLPGV